MRERRPPPKRGRPKGSAVAAEDPAYVAAKRGMGFSWQAVADITGRCELDLRRRFDPAFHLRRTAS